MNEQVIIGLFTIGGVIVGGLIGGLFSVKAAKISFKKEQMMKDIRTLSNQVKSYWFLEKEYLSKISKLSNNTPPEETVKKSTRKIVAEKGNHYPKMTAMEAQDILNKYE